MMIRHTKIFLFIGIVAIICCTTPHVSLADGTGALDAAGGTYGDTSNCNQTNANGFVPLACYANSPKIQQAFGSGNLPDYINNVFKIRINSHHFQGSVWQNSKSTNNQIS